MSEPIAPSPRAQTILLVEDNELVMEIARDVLESNGYRVESTFLPRVALDLAEKGNFTVDLLVTDVVMPQMNGPELYRRMLKLIPTLPVLYMSGYSGQTVQDVMQGEKAYFLSKPFKPSKLLEQVSHMLTA